MKPLAIFDIDGTIFRSSLLIELTLALVKFGIFPPIVEKEIEGPYIAWLNRQGSYENYIRKVVDVYAKRLKGVAANDIEKASRLVVKEQRSMVYVYTRELIQKLRGKYFLIALSGSPLEIVEAFNTYWKFNWISASQFEVRDGCYTGQVTAKPVLDKKKTLTDFLEAKKRNLKDSIGVGDTETDISFLEMVEKPICFNPNQKLYRMAKRQGWEVIVERKDVVYKIN